MDPENCPAELANAPCGELFGHVIRFNPMDKLRDAWPQRGMMLCLAVLEDGSVEVIEPLVPHFDRPMPEHELSLQEGGETAESWDAMKASLKATSSLFIAIFEQRHGACHEADRIRMNFPLRDQKSCSMWPSINLGKSYRRNIPIDWLTLKHLLTGILELYFSIWSKKMDFFLKKRYPSYVRSRILITSAFLGVSLPSAAHCETADDNATAQLEEITVIAQRTRENLQSVPISVSTVSDERLETVGIVSVSSLSKVVSGLSINATAQSFSPHIRGIGTTAFGPGVENPVALVVDDVYYASALFGLTDLADIEQVAVLKGPQGTLFGRNATGGVIQLTTREPNGEVGGELRTSLDNYLTSRSFAYLTGRVADNLNANLSVKFTTQGNGWGTNIRTGEDIRKIDHDLALRTKLAWAPGSETKINLALDYTSRKNSLGANLRPVPGYSTFFSSLDDPGVESDLQDVDTNITNRNRFKGGGASLTVNQGLGFATLSSISAYREYSNSIAFSAAGTNFPVVEVMPGSHWYGKQFTQEVRLISPSSSKLKWQIGGFYFWSNEGFDPLSETIFTNPAAPYSLKLDNSFKASSYALFGQATLPMGDATNFTAGIRYTHEERSASGRLDYTALGAGPPPPNSVVNASFDESRVTFRLALDHRIADDVMAYASFNRGFKSGGFDPFLTQTVPYRSEALDAYEVGLKAELLGKSLRINPSLFLNKYNDIQVSYIVGANAFIDNAAKAELYGIDLDVEWQVTNRLKLGGSLSYVHNEFTDYPNAPTTFPDPVFILLPGTIANARGNNLPYAPEFTYNLSLDYSIPLQKGDLAFNFTDSYSSSYASEPDNRLKQKAFHYLNAALTYTNDSGDLSLSIWGRNLLDEIVVSQLASYAFLGDIADYGNPPRTFGATLTYRFGQ